MGHDQQVVNLTAVYSNQKQNRLNGKLTKTVNYRLLDINGPFIMDQTIISKLWYIYLSIKITKQYWLSLCILLSAITHRSVECRTPEREVRGSRPTAAVLCPWARHLTPRKYWLITQEAMAPSRYDWKIVDWDVKPQHNQPTNASIIVPPWPPFDMRRELHKTWLWVFVKVNHLISIYLSI